MSYPEDDEFGYNNITYEGISDEYNYLYNKSNNNSLDSLPSNPQVANSIMAKEKLEKPEKPIKAAKKEHLLKEHLDDKKAKTIFNMDQNTMEYLVILLFVVLIMLCVISYTTINSLIKQTKKCMKLFVKLLEKQVDSNQND